MELASPLILTMHKGILVLMLKYYCVPKANLTKQSIIFMPQSLYVQSCCGNFEQ